MNSSAQLASSTSRTSTLAIETPEGVRFSLPLSGPVSRFLAWFIDAMAIGLISSGIGKLLAIIGAFSMDAMLALTALAYFAVGVGYGITFEWFWHGETPGKRALRLRVLDASGLRLQPSQIVLRNLIRFLDAIPALYLVGGASLILSSRNQRLGDLVANTVVIRRRRIAIPDLSRLATADKYNSLFEVPHLAARLRQHVSPELAQIGYEALLRRDELNAETRIEVFRELADQLRAIVKFPDEITASLTDERYVRNALEVVTTTNLRPGLADRSVRR